MNEITAVGLSAFVMAQCLFKHPFLPPSLTPPLPACRFQGGYQGEQNHRRQAQRIALQTAALLLKHPFLPPFLPPPVPTGFREETRVKDIRDRLSATAFPDAATLVDDANLGRLQVLMSK